MSRSGLVQIDVMFVPPRWRPTRAHREFQRLSTAVRSDKSGAHRHNDDRPPFDFVVLQGRARISEDLGEVRHWAARIGARYMGEERAEEFGERNGVPGELLVSVGIEKVLAHKAIAS